MKYLVVLLILAFTQLPVTGLKSLQLVAAPGYSAGGTSVPVLETNTKPETPGNTINERRLLPSAFIDELVQANRAQKQCWFLSMR